MTFNRFLCVLGRHDFLPIGKFDDHWIEWRCPHCKKYDYIRRWG